MIRDNNLYKLLAGSSTVGYPQNFRAMSPFKLWGSLMYRNELKAWATMQELCWFQSKSFTLAETYTEYFELLHIHWPGTFPKCSIILLPPVLAQVEEFSSVCPNRVRFSTLSWKKIHYPPLHVWLWTSTHPIILRLTAAQASYWCPCSPPLVSTLQPAACARCIMPCYRYNSNIVELKDRTRNAPGRPG